MPRPFVALHDPSILPPVRTTRRDPRLPRAAAFLLLPCVLGPAGCVEQTLTLDSNPSGALVTANDQELGRTPITRDFVNYGNYDLQIRHDGYETLSIHQQVNAPAWNWPPLDLFASLIPVRLKDHHHFTYTLTPASTQPIDPHVMEDRANQYKSMMESSQYTHAPTSRPATRSTTRPATRPS
jgi:hypothetical protein